MAEIPFHTTRMGKDFFDRTMPAIAKELKRIADALERAAPITPTEIEQALGAELVVRCCICGKPSADSYCGECTAQHFKGEPVNVKP